MTTMRFGYARVSTKDQTAAQQEEALKKAGIDQLFVEVASGAKKDRPQLAEIMKIARRGDTIVIWKLDRLARSLQHLITLSNEMRERGIELHSITDRLDTSTASGQLLFHILGSIAEFERSLIQERVQAGLIRARSEGRVGGRPRVDQSKLDIAFAEMRRGSSIRKAALTARLSRATLNRAISASKTLEMGKETKGSLEASLEAKKHPVVKSNGTSNHSLS